MNDMSGFRHPRRLNSERGDNLNEALMAIRPSKTPDTEDDSETSACPSPLLQIEGGYRIDPFTVYPIRASNGVRYMADYYREIWAPQQQAQAFSFGKSRNALLTLVLPRAFQDSMLFHATIAMTRVAWLLRIGKNPHDDNSLLKHRGMALKQLRAVLMSSQEQSSESLLLTMSTFITLDYMLNLAVPFRVHLQALSTMLESSATASEHNELTDFLRGRVLAFDAVSSFMHPQQAPYASRINEPGHRISTLTYPRHPFTPELCALISSIPEGFAELALSKTVSVELISLVARLTIAVNDLTSNPTPKDRAPKGPTLPDQALSTTTRKGPMTMQRAIYDLQSLLGLPLTVFESQLAHALTAFCFILYNTLASPDSHVAFSRPLRTITTAFNTHTDIPRAKWQQRCLLWCAVVIGSAWEPSATNMPPQSHNVVLDRLAMFGCGGRRKWGEMEEVMKGFFWHDQLRERWKECWESALARLSGEEETGCEYKAEGKT